MLIKKYITILYFLLIYLSINYVPIFIFLNNKYYDFNYQLTVYL